MSNEIAVQNGGAIAVTPQPGELSIEQVLGQLAKIQTLMRQAMVEAVDYGVIPGTPKPTLFKPGAEKLCLMFRLDPEYEIVKDIQEGHHLTIMSRCVLYHIPTGTRMGSGMGSCSTRESRYAWRNAARACPECGEETVKKGAAKFGGGFYCDQKVGGCGAKFTGAAAQAIAAQETGRAENPDVADQWNTVLKMANKRAQVAAVLNVTGASQIFTQDIEDFQKKAAAQKPAQEAVPERRQSPDDPATPAQRKALWALLRKKFGEDHARLWIDGEMGRLGHKKADDLRVKDIAELTRKALEEEAAAASQEPMDEEQRQPGEED